jgi:hypothetical protein
MNHNPPAPPHRVVTFAFFVPVSDIGASSLVI